jgi:hypothetical protein
MAKTASASTLIDGAPSAGSRKQVDQETGDRGHTASAAPSEATSKRVQLQLNAEDCQLLEEVKRGMTMARNQTDTVILSLKFVNWILTLQKQGYKLAMVKDNQVEAVQVFM